MALLCARQISPNPKAGTPVERWHGTAEVPQDFGPSVVTIGVFDGVHRGHREVVRTAVAQGRELGLPTVVLTFDPHPSEIVRPGSHPPLLTTQRHRAELLASEGVDAVLVLPFSLEVSRWSPAEFIALGAGREPARAGRGGRRQLPLRAPGRRRRRGAAGGRRARTASRSCRCT